MGKLRNIIIGVAAAAGFMAAAAPSFAQIMNSICGLETQTVTATTYYDPFNPSPVSAVTVNVPLTRFDGPGGQKTQNVDFYFGMPAGSPAYQILYQGTNVLYTETCASNGCSGVGAPALTPSGTSSGTVPVAYNGQGLPSTQTLPFTITIPAGVDLSNGLNVKFDIFYQCKGTGGYSTNGSNQYLAQAITMPVVVLDALQAYYVGPALDFGTITSVTTAQASSHTVNGQIHVASSGPYTVTMKSDAANPYRMTYAGGSTATSGQYIPYKVTLLTQTTDNASPTFNTVSCTRAGVISGQTLAISATLEDGGVGKTPAAYQDNLEVTVTPLAAAPSPAACS